MSGGADKEGSFERIFGDKDSDSLFKQEGASIMQCPSCGLFIGGEAVGGQCPDCGTALDGEDRGRQKSVLLADDSTMARGRIGAILGHADDRGVGPTSTPR